MLAHFDKKYIYDIYNGNKNVGYKTQKEKYDFAKKYSSVGMRFTQVGGLGNKALYNLYTGVGEKEYLRLMGRISKNTLHEKDANLIVKIAGEKYFDLEGIDRR
jgi:hypothetical protein